MKNIPREWSDVKLKEFFEQWGEVSSTKVELDSKQESKGFGFVCYENSDDAKTCIDKANKMKLESGEEL